MKKIYILDLLFLCIAILGFIPLTITVFGDMNPNIIKIEAVVVGIGLGGASICAIIRAIKDKRK